jgi:phosphinothricin acetyltransferase
MSFEIEPPNEQEMARRIQDTLPSHPWLVLEGQDGVVGYAYASRHRGRAAYQWSVETSVYVHAKVQRRGVGRGLYTSLIEILVAQRFANAYAGITLPNDGSVALHETMGYQAIGTFRNVGFKFGGWHDVGWWQLPLRAAVDSPTPPLSLSEVQREPSWRRRLEAGLPCVRGVS